MDNSIVSKCRKFVIALCGAVALTSISPAQGAIPVGTGGSGTIGFSTPPTNTEWSTRNIAGAGNTFNDQAAIDLMVQTNTASIITNVITVSTSDPPGANAEARYSQPGTYVQTRPTGNAATLLMATFQNVRGSAITSFDLIYNLNHVQAATEQVLGHSVYYSLTGTASNWVLIDTITGDAASGSKSKTIDLSATPWANNALFYILWSDDNNDGSTDGGLQLDNVAVSFPGIPAQITQHPPANTNRNECSQLFLSAAASGTAPIMFQWQKESPPNSGNYLDITDNPSATSSTLTFTNIRSTDAGRYRLHVSNVSAGADSTPSVVTVTPDTTGPIMVGAQVNAARTLVVVSFSEPIAAPVPGAGDEFLLFIQENASAAPINDFNPATFNVQNGTNMTVGLTPGAWVEGAHYRVFDQGGGAKDICNNNPSSVADIPVHVPFIIQEGLFGYSGTQDTELRLANPDTAQGDRADFINIDTSDGTPSGPTQGLLRFDNIFGSGPNQIPLGSTINSARLRLTSSGANANGSPVTMHRMLIDWSEASATWNSLVDGVSADGVEAVVTPVASWNPNLTVPFTFDLEVRQSLQEWANGTPNYGWAILPTSTDGYRIDPSEHATANNRPMLTVDFTVPEPTRLGIPPGGNPPAAITTNEGRTFSISVTVTGAGPNFVWQKLNPSASTYTNIPGATSSTYTKANAVPGAGGDSGSYKLTACNAINCVTSTVTVVTINPDTTPPTITGHSAGTDMTTLTLTFSRPVTVATAQTLANYSITPNVGISSATLSSDGLTVTLITGARTFRTVYTVRVSNVRDRTFTGNLISPNPTDVAVEQAAMVLAGAGYFDPWKYELGSQDGAAWTNADVSVYDDALWLEGPGIFGNEPSGNGSNTLVAAGLMLAPTFQPATIWTLGANQTTYYVRKRVTVPAMSLDDIAFEMHHYIDDGAICYVNGPEAWRMGFGPTNVTFASVSAGAPGAGTECILLTNTLPLHVGQNLVAVEVHQNSTTSSDVVFGAQIVAVHRLARPGMTIAQSGGNVTISWSPAAGQLEESTDLVNWSNSSRANGTPSPPSGGIRFYRVRR